MSSASIASMVAGSMTGMANVGPSGRVDGRTHVRDAAGAAIPAAVEH